MANRQRQIPSDLPNAPNAPHARLSELQRLRDLYDEAPVGYHELDMAGRIVSVNHTELRMLGYAADEMLGRPVWEFIIELDEARQAVTEKLSGSPAARMAFDRTYRRKDGAAMSVLINDHLLHDDEGRIIGMRSTIQDITERKRVVEALRASEAQYRSLFENMLDGFAYCRMLFEDRRPQDFIYIEVNSAFEKLTGLRNVVGKRVTEVIPGIRESHPELFAMYGRVALTGLPEWCEVYLKPLDMWLSIAVYSPQPEHFAAVFENITARKLAARALAESEKKFHRLYDSIRDGVLRTTLKGEILECNPAYLKMLGYTSEEIVRLTYQQLTPPKWRDMEVEIVERQVMANGYSDEYEKEYIRKDGSVFPITIKMWLARDDFGNPVGMWGIVRDITERKRMQEALDSLALVDDLTCLYNRRGFVPLAEQQLKIARRANRKMVLAFMDLDGLKAANDQYGHVTGDMLLCDAARMLRKTFRESDIIARIGGDEFVVLMVDIHDIAPADLAARLQAHIKERNVTEAAPPLSLSAGLAEYDPANPCDITELLRRADGRMYEEKRRKRAQQGVLK